MAQLFNNNASTTLSAAIAAGDVSMNVIAGDGALFASPASAADYQLITLTDGTNLEIIKATGRSNDIFTIVRAQEGTTAQAWAIGAIVEARLTAAPLNRFEVKIDNNAAGTAALALGDSSAAAGSNAVAAGTSSSAAGASNIAVGYNAAVNNLNGLAIGYAANASTWPAGTAARINSTAYSAGDKATVTDYLLVCVKAGTTDTAPPTWDDGFIIDGSVVWSSCYTAAGSTGAVAIGQSSASRGGNGVAVGIASDAVNSSIGIGNTARARGFKGVAIGNGAAASHVSSVSIGDSASSIMDYGLNISGMPALGNRPQWLFGNEYQGYGGLDGYLQSEPMDLTGGATWAATTSAAHGSVVKPTTPNGCQYVRWCNNYNFANNPLLSTYTAGLTGGTEPTWPTTFGLDVADGDGYWVCVPHDGSYVMALPADASMLVSEIGFMAYDASTVTVQPTISAGTTGDLTKLVNAQTTAGLTAAMTVYRWALTQPLLVPDLTIKIDTLATGTKLLGRFYFKGVFTRHWL